MIHQHTRANKSIIFGSRHIFVIPVRLPKIADKVLFTTSQSISIGRIKQRFSSLNLRGTYSLTLHQGSRYIHHLQQCFRGCVLQLKKTIFYGRYDDRCYLHVRCHSEITFSGFHCAWIEQQAGRFLTWLVSSYCRNKLKKKLRVVIFRAITIANCSQFQLSVLVLWLLYSYKHRHAVAFYVRKVQIKKIPKAIRFKVTSHSTTPIEHVSPIYPWHIRYRWQFSKIGNWGCK